MTKRSFRARFLRAAMALAVGGSAFQLSGCDPAVRASLISGLQATTLGLSNALITAFFLSLDSGSGTTTTGTTTTGTTTTP